MNDQDAKLMRCFKAVFPRLSTEEITHASVETLVAWDSVAMISLFNIISEEFGIEIDWDNFQELTSYMAIKEMIAGPVRQT
jgi:acyl carrier protein